MGTKHLPQIPDEQSRRYLFVAIDRATRWVFMHIYADQSEDSCVDFLNRLEHAAPMNIVQLLTDNGSQFTSSMCDAKRWALSIVCAHPVTRKPTVWSSASTAGSPRYSIRRALHRQHSWRQR